MGTRTKGYSSPHNGLTYSNVRKKVQEDGMNFSYDVHVLLAKSEKLVGRRRWLSSYDKSIQLLSPMNGVQTVRNFIIWPNLRAGKIKRILCSYWQPKPFLLSRNISRWSLKKNVLVLAMINPLLTKLVQSRYLDIGLVLF